MPTQQNSNAFYTDMIDALSVMGFEYLEMNFYRRIENVDSTSIILYCELKDTSAEVTIYEDGSLVQETVVSDPLDFIDYVESQLKSYGIDSISLTPFEASVTINGRPIMANSERFSTRDFIKKLIRVKSSNLWSYAFQPKDYNKGDMLIQFKGAQGGPDDIYIYYDIPTKIWQKFVAAPSKGAFFWRYIRNVAKYAKLTGDKRTKLPNGI